MVSLVSISVVCHLISISVVCLLVSISMVSLLVHMGVELSKCGAPDVISECLQSVGECVWCGAQDVISECLGVIRVSLINRRVCISWSA